ncbi:MAG: PorV/PorQ family protein [Elusimicrobia bacterium]|nr:PorV/PorQ family protein [Candidatus Liberimonas magnetica]
MKTTLTITNLIVRNPIRILMFVFVVNWLLVTGHCSLVYAAATGGQPGQFLSWGAGGRSLGMGSAFFAVSDDASATYWNPAGLTQIDRKELMALHVTLFADTSYDFISYVHPTPKMGVFGANVTRLSSGGFEKVAVTFNPAQTDIINIENLGTFEDVSTALTFAYGKKIKENTSIGVSGKYITHTLDTSVSGFATFDTTLFVDGMSNTLKDLKLGFGIQNLISTKLGDTDDVLPLILKIGASQKFLRDKLMVALDLDKNMNTNMGWHIGTEYWAINFVALRLGFQGESGLRETTAGFGVKYKDYSIDYAFALHDLGFSQRLSGSWRFGPSVRKDRDSLVNRYLQEGIEAYRQGNFMLAHERLEASLEIDPTNKEVQKSFNKIQLITGYVKEATGENEEVSAIRKAVSGYMEGDNKTAINALRYAYYKNPSNVKVLALLNRIEQQLGQKLTDAHKEEVVGFTIIDQKIYDSRQAIIEGKYDEALIKCQDILNLEPENITALEMMGSAFFMMDQPDKAKEIWMKVLELDPTNKIVPEFLNQLK